MSADKTTKDMNIEEYFNDKYPDYHLRDCIESNDPLSLKELADEYAEYKHSFSSNVSNSDLKPLDVNLSMTRGDKHPTIEVFNSGVLMASGWLVNKYE